MTKSTLKSISLAAVYIMVETQAKTAKTATGICKFSSNEEMELVIGKMHENYGLDYSDGSGSSGVRPQDMAAQTEIWMRNEYSAPCQMINRVLSKNGDMQRTLGDGKGFNCYDEECDVAMDLRGIWGYGCWCHFGSKLLNGRGTPVNLHDEACKRMQLCLRCAEMDGQKDDYACDPRTTNYNSTLGQAQPGQNDNINSINSGCQVQNPNDLCGAHVCTCEIQLINDILELVWTQYTHDPKPRHPSNPYGGDFDFAANCKTDPGVTEIDCCGKYPFRYTYNSLQKSCCLPSEKLYNPYDTQCCKDGPKKIGEIC